ncbi:MAG TPA: hypothetical protein PLV92_16520, partial [Pirellulaceae bacterium]|nr:hypothetical protein [Pirellulaceae bacterium]
AKYDDQIGRALIGYPEVGKQAGTSAFDWDRLHAQVLRLVKTEGPQELRGVSTLTQLIDRWFQLSATSDEEVKKIAETIAAACRKVLHAAQLNLADFFDGSVIDLMMVNLNSAERNSKIQNILKFSAPYLPLDLQNQATMTANYRPVADNLMGKKRGESPRSAANEAALDQLIESELQRLSGMRDGEINRTDGSPSSLVLCREVWGVPLQYYLDLNRLYAVYQNSGRDRNESHINFRESEEELPDIRAIDPRVYEKIRDGIEYVLYAMMRSTVTCRDGSYIVKVPDRFGNMNTFAVGSRVSRIIKRCCESDAIREHLRRDQEEWERSATPKQWAALFASAWATYQDTSHLIRDQAAGVSPPLRNCFQLLLDRIIAHLNETQEGRQWFDALRVRTRENKDSTESIQAYEKLFAELKSRKVLFRAIAHVPIYEINWDALDEIRLPNDAATRGRAAAGGGADAAGTGTPAP